MSRLRSCLRLAVGLAAVAALAAGCASERTTTEHRMALDACLASPDPYNSPDCERARILRDQMDYERSQNTALAAGAFAVSILTLGIIAVADDDCCGHRYGGYWRY